MRIKQRTKRNKDSEEQKGPSERGDSGTGVGTRTVTGAASVSASVVVSAGAVAGEVGVEWFSRAGSREDDTERREVETPSEDVGAVEMGGESAGGSAAAAWEGNCTGERNKKKSTDTTSSSAALPYKCHYQWLCARTTTSSMVEPLLLSSHCSSFHSCR
jgi:hypothetical protein